MQQGNYFFHTVVTKMNLALVMQALRAADGPKEQIEADIGSLMKGGIAEGKTRALDLLLQYNVAYVNYGKNCVMSHDGRTRFAEIKWALRSGGRVVSKQPQREV